MIFAVHKPKGISSYDVIRSIKLQHEKGTKIGHGGTLDPQAEGVLVIAVGRESTRQLSAILKDSTKEYIAEIELGKISHTDDSEGPITPGLSQREPSSEEIQKILTTFTGDILQKPPVFSAIKIKGETAYSRARRGEVVEIQPKHVHIDSIEMRDYTYPVVTIHVQCGSGVYIRALARDIGEKLGTGAYMKSLIRTRVGEFTLDAAESYQ